MAEAKTFKATVTSVASKTMTKSNDAEYVIHSCEITEEGPLKGISVPAARTIKNGEGEDKAGVDKDQEVVLYLSMYTNKDGNVEPRFEISTGSNTATSSEIMAALGLATA